MSTVRVRFAPSPTGYPHVGGARTALYCYLFAKKMKGSFILRIEDTDQERSTHEALIQHLSSLKWLVLDWDEGPHFETLQDTGSFGPYRQSARQDLYNQYAQELIEKGLAYYCFLSDSEHESLQAQAQSAGKSQARNPYRDQSLEQAKVLLAKGKKAVVRFKVPEQRTDFVVDDLIRGSVSFPSEMVGDFVLLRSDGMPVYNFCNVIDDALMEITHVIRAEEHLPNTLRQIMLYQAFGFKRPQFVHVSIILGPDKQKLSKRHGATSCEEYRQRGYLPEALLNYLSLLGWTAPDEKEIMTIEEIIERFELEKVHSSPAVFDEAKLNWVNAQHLRSLSNEVLWFHIEQQLKKNNIEWVVSEQRRDQALNLFKNYIQNFSEAVEYFSLLIDDQFSIDSESKEILSSESARSVISYWVELILQSKNQSEFLNEDEFIEIQNQVKTHCGVKGKHLFMPIRVAVVGKPHGAELKELVPLIAKESLVKRAQLVLSHSS